MFPPQNKETPTSSQLIGDDDEIMRLRDGLEEGRPANGQESLRSAWEKIPKMLKQKLEVTKDRLKPIADKADQGG